MNVLIENYRGFDIIFDTNTERFSYSIDEGNWREKQSYASCKKNIDDYIKLNKEFKPFKVRYKRGNIIYNIVGIRKDNKFVYQNEDMSSTQNIGGYYEKDYILMDEKDDAIYNDIAMLKAEIAMLEQKVRDKYASITTPTLRDIKQNYIK